MNTCTLSPLERGMRSESLVAEALRTMIGKLILGFVHNEPNSVADHNGRDFTLKTPAGELGLQVKSSDRGAQSFLIESQRHREEIPVIVVNKEDTVDSLLSRLVALIVKAYQHLQRNLARRKGAETIRLKLREERRIRTPRICHYAQSMHY
jgi:hypothetical protein